MPRRPTGSVPESIGGAVSQPVQSERAAAGDAVRPLVAATTPPVAAVAAVPAGVEGVAGQAAFDPLTGLP
ncbi:MAG: hypothetical protein ACRDV3_05120, partial [Acidothermaceae bacterium]